MYVLVRHFRGMVSSKAAKCQEAALYIWEIWQLRQVKLLKKKKKKKKKLVLLMVI